MSSIHDAPLEGIYASDPNADELDCPVRTFDVVHGLHAVIKTLDLYGDSIDCEAELVSAALALSSILQNRYLWADEVALKRRPLRRSKASRGLSITGLPKATGKVTPLSTGGAA